ncbi:biotin transporter BioY [Barrientosiimonas endolithica]|uniref:Biotin transporter n=1 Tax=Barrientosiimonas endolithica TaxID=1535208 RepID=A0ABN6YU90_9MICO|nr:biotin transporter BioY [Barrientosiimonas endolithica]BDZ58973.1 BioY family transporter [Barrientosiimonas endolithica]
MPKPTPRDLALVAMFAALIAVLGMPGGISFFGSVPITLQSLGWMVAACLLGAWRGALTMIVFNLLLAAGLPIGAGGRGGLGVLTGVSGGYLVGAVLGMFVTGLIAERVGRRNLVGLFVACVVGCMIVVYAVGIPWSAWRLGSGTLGVAQASLQFLPGDLVKAALAALITTTVVWAYPPIVQERERERVPA